MTKHVRSPPLFPRKLYHKLALIQRADAFASSELLLGKKDIQVLRILFMYFLV